MRMRSRSVAIPFLTTDSCEFMGGEMGARVVSGGREMRSAEVRMVVGTSLIEVGTDWVGCAG